MEKMHFSRMDQGSDEDFQILKRVHEQNLAELPDRLIAMVNDLSADAAYNLNRRGHSLQAATRAMRDGANEELIVVALLHDIGETLGPINHGEVAAAVRVHDVKVTTHAVQDDPADALLDVAAEAGAGLIVVGNRGMHSAKRFVLGNVPNKVSHRASCNVLIVSTDQS